LQNVDQREFCSFSCGGNTSAYTRISLMLK
jgi:hypothetical protein